MDKDLPPKIDRKSKKISSLGLTEEEGIAYGNVFLYSKKLKVLFYEVNRDSIYLDVFRIFLYKCFNSSKKMNKEYTFNIHFSTIFRKDEYRRALDMDKYKGFKMKVYQPQKLLKELKTINSSLEDKIDFDFMPEIENAAKLNSEYAQIEYTVQYAKKKAGLYKDKIEPMIRKIGQMLKFGQLRDNIQEIEICGYNTEYASSQVAIDLVGDVYSGSFQLNIPRLNNSLQITERVRAIKGVFEKEFSILENY
ncbi:hypothetical protein [Capnocytophaga catalasegens]|nr:hypothetical protein [Capnocytophaga catalasegens]